MKRMPDIAGRRFGKLVALREHGVMYNHHIGWLCQCDCGNQKVVSRANMLSGVNKSCGCMKSNFRHGHHRTPGYNSYKQMIARCHDVAHKDFIRYGARGITVCERWRKGDNGKDAVVCFFDDMGPCPSKGHSIDRIDNEKGYFPANCRWATVEQQARNRRNNYFAPGVDPQEMCRKAGVQYSTFRQRVSKGWSGEEALDGRDYRVRS